MLLMRAVAISWASGRGFGPGNLEFFRPQMACAFWLDAISQGPKNSRFPAPSPLPPALVQAAARIKSITQGAI